MGRFPLVTLGTRTEHDLVETLMRTPLRRAGFRVAPLRVGHFLVLSYGRRSLLGARGLPAAIQRCSALTRSPRDIFEGAGVAVAPATTTRTLTDGYHCSNRRLSPVSLGSCQTSAH